VRLLLIEALQQRKCEGRRLACARLGRGQQIAAVVNRRDGAVLDGRGYGVPEVLHGAQESGRKAESVERHECSIALLPHLREPAEASLLE
jgi:hypothetical protein